MTGSNERGPTYPSREEVATRTSASETDPNEFAATALDPPKITEEWLAASDPPPRPIANKPPASSAARPSRVPPWIALLGLAVVGGFSGALFALWLALR